MTSAASHAAQALALAPVGIASVRACYLLARVHLHRLAHPTASCARCVVAARDERVQRLAEGALS